MNRREKLLMIAIGSAIGLAVVYGLVNSLLLKPRAALHRSIAERGKELTELRVPEGVLLHGTEYVWRTRFRDSQNGWSDWSPYRRFFTADAPPEDKPESLSASAGGCSSVSGRGALLLLPLMALLLRRL